MGVIQQTPVRSRTLEELRDAIDHLAPIVGAGLTGRLLSGVAKDGPDGLTAREALSILTAQLAVLSQFRPSTAA